MFVIVVIICLLFLAICDYLLFVCCLLYCLSNDGACFDVICLFSGCYFHETINTKTATKSTMCVCVCVCVCVCMMRVMHVSMSIQKWDEWIEKTNHRLAPRATHSNARMSYMSSRWTGAVIVQFPNISLCFLFLFLTLIELCFCLLYRIVLCIVWCCIVCCIVCCIDCIVY